MLEAEPPLARDPEVLLQHAPWLRGLARRLVRDAARAEDLVQDTWLSAMQAGPRRIADLRAWLAGAVCNLARFELRGEARRRRRELAAAASRGSAAGATADLVARLHDQKALLDAVEALPEAYREVILLRFFDELPPRAIARRTGLPVATVRTRIHRALARLRKTLDRRFGSRAGWVQALSPLACPGAPAFVTASTLAIVMKAHTKLFLALLLAVLLAGGLSTAWCLSGTAASPPEAGSPSASAARDRGTPEPATQPAQRREALAPAAGADTAAARTVPPPTPDAATLVRGKVYHADGRTLAGVPVVLRAAPGGADAVARATTREDGAFEMPGDAVPRFVEIDSPDLVTLYWALAERGGDGCVVVAAPKQALLGRVLDDEGCGVAAHVASDLEAGLAAGFPVALEHSSAASWSTDARPDGTFALPDLARHEHLVLVATAPGLRSRRIALTAGQGFVEIVLHRPKSRPGAITGLVLDRRGVPVAHAFVGTGQRQTITDASGEFVLEPAAGHGAGPDELYAVKPGHRAAFATCADRSQPVTLRLEGEALAIEGRVVDARGSACAGFKVWLLDPTQLDQPETGIVPLESVAALPTAEGPTRLQGKVAGWQPVATDEHGRFRIGGLSARSYRLAAMNPKTSQIIHAAPAAAGEKDVRIVMPEGGLFARLRGRVVSRAGSPVRGVSVGVAVTAVEYRSAHGTVRHGGGGGASARTDADGRFELADVPKAHACLDLSGGKIMPAQCGGEDGLAGLVTGDPPELQIVVSLRCRLRVERAEGDGKDMAVRVLDRDGKEMEISVFSAFTVTSTPAVAFANGATEVLSVGDTAATVVLMRGDEEVRRAPLQLDPERVTTVRL